MEKFPSLWFANEGSATKENQTIQSQEGENHIFEINLRKWNVLDMFNTVLKCLPNRVSLVKGMKTKVDIEISFPYLVTTVSSHISV